MRHGIDRLFLVLDLDNTGRVMKATGFPPDLSQRGSCDVKEVAGWKFRPALLDGKPVATKLNLLLRLYGKDQAPHAADLPVSRREAAHPVTVVDAFAPARPGGSWRLLYSDALVQLGR
ncbi:MAG: hypothetical protein WBE20_07150 [Candidatus Acidiferrales bacterium]